METEAKVVIQEMPSKEVLEKFLGEIIMGRSLSIFFSIEEGRFVDRSQNVKV